MSVILAAALFEREDRVLVARRRADRPPFAGQWLPPFAVVAEQESDEETLARHAREQLATNIAGQEFVETVYVEDPALNERYVTNVYRVGYEGEVRFRAGGPYDDVRWLLPEELAALEMPVALRDWLLALLRPEGEAPPVGVKSARAAATEVSEGDLTYEERKRRLYQEYAQSYDEEHASWLGEERQARLLAFVTEGLEPGMRVLDAGCGTGVHLRAISEAIGREGACVGMDISPEMLALARRQLIFAKNFALRACDLSRGIPLGDACLDAVVAMGLVDQLPDAALFFGEAHRVLRPGGSLAAAAICYEGDSPAERAHAEASREHDYYYSPYQEVISAVSGAGLAIESAEFVPLAPIPRDERGQPQFRPFREIEDRVRAQGFDPAEVRMGSAMIRARREA
jgi:ubiquinone/menaquinone biosynthesis C-methylase UbiE